MWESATKRRLGLAGYLSGNFAGVVASSPSTIRACPVRTMGERLNLLTLG